MGAAAAVHRAAEAGCEVALTRPWAWAVVCTAALGNLANGNPENQKAIAAAGGVEAVLGAMRAHPGAAEVQQHGCGGARAPVLPCSGPCYLASMGRGTCVYGAGRHQTSV